MRRHRAIITTATLLVAGVVGTIPATASAGSLLSGYGGPGQGNQAILGSALIGGSSGGGGTGGPAALGSTATGSGQSAGGPSTVAAGTAGRKGPVHSARSRHGVGGKDAPAPRSSETPAGAARSGTSRLRVGAGGAEEASTPALGITGADLVYILLATGALVLTGGLTRQLTRQTR
jgi:hypothetical protein